MYVVIGASGYMGAYMIKNILEKTDEEILAVCRSPRADAGNRRVRWAACDISDEQSVLKLNRQFLKPSPINKVIYLAAFHHPDQVEQAPRVAWNINVTALSRFVNCADNVVSFFYPSTDSVYGEGADGRRFVESDPLHPVNRYGRDKAAAEGIVTFYQHHVVRYPFLIAPSLTKKKHFYDTIADSLLNGKTIEMFYDSYRSSLDFNTAAELTIELAERTANGEPIPSVINVCGDESLSKYDVGLRIADLLGCSRDLVVPISINASSGIFKAHRAASTLMDNSLLKRILGLAEVKLTL